jgi:hypothetical protein
MNAPLRDACWRRDCARNRSGVVRRRACDRTTAEPCYLGSNMSFATGIAEKTFGQPT